MSALRLSVGVFLLPFICVVNFRVISAGECSVVSQYDGWPNEMKFGPDGRLWIVG